MKNPFLNHLKFLIVRGWEPNHFRTLRIERRLRNDGSLDTYEVEACRCGLEIKWKRKA